MVVVDPSTETLVFDKPHFSMHPPPPSNSAHTQLSVIAPVSDLYARFKGRPQAVAQGLDALRRDRTRADYREDETISQQNASLSIWKAKKILAQLEQITPRDIG